MKFIRPIFNLIYNIHYPEGIQLLTRLRLELSHLKDHELKHNFLDTVHPLSKVHILKINPLERNHYYRS